MKRCPNCQKRYSDQAQFCIGCGSELEPYQVPESRIGKAVKGFLKAIGYIFLWIGVMSLVEDMFMTAVMMSDPVVVAGITDGTLTADALMEMSGQWDEIMAANGSRLTIVQNLVTILVVCLFFTLRRKNPAQEISFRPVKKGLLPICALYGIALNIFVVVTLSFLPIPVEAVENVNEQYAGLFVENNLFIALLSTAVLTGLVEEIIFRGLVLSRLKRGLGRVAAIIVSALIFGWLHGVPLAVAYATVLGLVFGLLADRHNSILPTVVCHIFFNATSFFLVTEDVFLLLSLYFLSIVVLFVGSYILFKKDRIEE